MPYDRSALTTPLLTPAEEVELGRRIAEGREAKARIERGEGKRNDARIVADAERARTHFIEANIRLVLSMAAKSKAPAHVDRDDLVQDGMIGLERAVEKFDWRKGYRFSTYASWWIRQAIQRGLEHTASPVRVPAHRASELRTALAVGGGDASSLPRTLAAAAAVMHVDSLDRPIGDGGEALGDLAPAHDAGPDAEVEAGFDRAVVADLVDTLDPSTRHAVVARFGLDGGEPQTYAHIAHGLGISPEAVRRRVVRALEGFRSVAAEKLVA